MALFGFLVLDLLFLSLHLIDCNAQLISSTGQFTFCSGESVTLTCLLTSSTHTWTISNFSTIIILSQFGVLNNSLDKEKILFNITGLTHNNNITMSTMTFNASVDVIINGSVVSCSGNGVDLMETIETFDFPSPGISLSGVGSSGTGFDTNVTIWQDSQSSYFRNITAGRFHDGKCQASEINGVSQVFPHKCSDAGKKVTFCVVFDYTVCRSTSVASRQLPSPNASNVTVSSASAMKNNQITLSIELNNISGELCNLTHLWVQYDLHNRTAQSQGYKVGNNMQVFKGLALGIKYDYQIRITVNDEDVIASFRGSATIPRSATKIPRELNLAAILPPTVVGVPTVGVTGIVLLLCYKRKRSKKADSHDVETLKEKELELDNPRHAPVERDLTDVECGVVDKTKSSEPFASQPTEQSHQMNYADNDTGEKPVIQNPDPEKTE